MSSTLCYADGRTEKVSPAGAYWSLKELQTARNSPGSTWPETKRFAALEAKH